MFDLDRFKQVNDRHGHEAGDAALRAFADVLRLNTRRMDLSARFGGEEFISIRGGSGIPPAVVLANRARVGLEEQNFPDVMMPRMNGLALADRILTSHPGLRVVYLSGYLRNDVSWAGLPGAVTGFAAKPVDPQSLLAMARDVLDRAVGAG